MISTKLFCPVCGTMMTQQETGWYCQLGEAYIAKAVIAAIAEAIEQIPARPLTEIPEKQLCLFFGYCSRCGQRFISTPNGTRVCPECSLLLRGGVFYVLQEHGGHQIDAEASHRDV